MAERDLEEFSRDLRPPTVLRILRMLANRHGQIVNVSALARDFGAGTSKVRTFLDALEAAYLWKRIEPFVPNTSKRLTRSPRGWLADAGLLHALLRISSPDDLEHHPVLGPSWEGWVLSELRRQASLIDPPPTIMFWRTLAGAKVDVVLESGHRLVPVEIKRGTSIGGTDLRGMRSFLTDHADRAAFGVVLYRSETIARLEERIVAVPVQHIL